MTLKLDELTETLFVIGSTAAQFRALDAIGEKAMGISIGDQPCSGQDYPLLTYQIKQDKETEKWYVIIWNGDRIVTDFGDYLSYDDAMQGANGDSMERQNCLAPMRATK